MAHHMTSIHHPRTDEERKKRIWQFLRESSPEADPTGVLLFGEIMHASRHLVAAAERNLASVGLSWAKFRLLSSLLRGEAESEAEGLQPSELSELQGIGRNSVSALINSLERDNLITRELHSRDRRRFVIRLTPRGRSVIQAKMENHLRFVGQCFGSLTPEERQQLLTQMHRLVASLEEDANR